MTSIKRRSLFAFLTLLVASACTHQNEGSILVLEGDEKKTCSELNAEYADADRLSEENIDFFSRPRFCIVELAEALRSVVAANPDLHLIFAVSAAYRSHDSGFLVTTV